MIPTLQRKTKDESVSGKHKQSSETKKLEHDVTHFFKICPGLYCSEVLEVSAIMLHLIVKYDLGVFPGKNVISEPLVGEKDKNIRRLKQHLLSL